MFWFISLYIIGNALTASAGRQLLVGYWGQNSAGHSQGLDNFEKPLKEVCQTTKYDILNVAFLHNFFDTRNQGSLPALNLAHHCSQKISKETPTLLRCPEIEDGITECQKLGKKVLISVGGATADGTPPSPMKAREFAHTLYDLFLGGDRRNGQISLRPFGSAVMDGVDLNIEGGRPEKYPDFIGELHRLMDSTTGEAKKSYLITAAPQCHYPDHFLGPGKNGTALEEAGALVDFLFVKFYNDYCHTGNQKSFRSALDKWLSFAQPSNRPLVFVGLPAHYQASSSPNYYRSPSELQSIYEKLKTKPSIGGIVLWDVSWDQKNIVDGSRYSDHVFGFLDGTSITKAPTQGGATIPGQETSQVSFSCEGKSDGTYPNPSDCTKYYICTGGDTHEGSCPPSLLFSKKTQNCDWGGNVNC